MIRLRFGSWTAVWLSAAVVLLASGGTLDAAQKPAAKPSAKLGAVQMPETFPGPMLSRFLDGPMKDVEEIVFAVRVPGHDHWYVTFGNYADFSEYPQKLAFKKEDGVYWGYGEGGRLCRLNLRTGKLTTVLEDAKGGVRDPQLSYDGKKILFAYRKGGTHPFHLYEINVDGSDLRQLTDGTDDDIEPTYCPDGSIVFGSSRCRRFVNCWYTRVATLYRCDADGGNVRMLSTNNDHDNTPWMMPDGRLLYMRWEYVDRSQVHFHHLWTMNPDGTGQTVFYGNMTGGIAMLDAKPIPGTGKVIASFSPGHGRPEHLGPITVVDPQFGPDDPRGAHTVSKTGDWKDPYAFNENCFLVAHARGLFVMDGEGNVEMIYQLPEAERAQFQCNEPRPIQSRPREPIIPSRVDLNVPTGRLFLEDIYHGRNMDGVERGTVRKLLVLQQLPKPVNFSGGMEPLTIGGSFTLAEVVGEAPVEPDGSAYLEVPAMRSLFFVALDKNDLAVKRMHSFVTVQPGETIGCVGCHENRQSSALPSRATLLAMKRPPSPVQPIRDVPSVLDFPRDIQPILDRHCVQCHNPDRRTAKVDLTGDKTATYCMSYWTITARGLISDARNQPYANRAPYSYGSAASRLMKLIDGSHHDAKLSDLERKTVRLWIETSATYPGTYASLGCGSYPVHLPHGAVMQHCGACHRGTVHDHRGKAYETLVICGAAGHYFEQYENLSRPEKSYVLLAPLAKEAGGLQLCGKVVFASTGDPLYRDMLASLRDAQAQLMAGKRFDMPGFRPNEHYIREMQRFGILPKSLGPNDPIDVYATDRAYWDSFYYRPVTTAANASAAR
jgi:Hydrazine synthase alpha subunit middle domain